MTTIAWSSPVQLVCGTGSVQDSDYVSAARTPDGRLVMAYIPEGQRIGVDLSGLATRVRARWYDPTNGPPAGPGSPLDNAGTHSLASREERRSGSGLGPGARGDLEACP